LARRTALCGNGRAKERGLDSPQTNATRAPISSAPSAQQKARARRWRCRLPTARRCRLHLEEISRNVAVGAQAVLLFDRAGWHSTPNLVMPENITPIWLPSHAPELNPVENVWQYLRQTWLSNRAFETYADSSMPHAKLGTSSPPDPTS
jgi:hypothetical protein